MKSAIWEACRVRRSSETKGLSQVIGVVCLGEEEEEEGSARAQISSLERCDSCQNS